MTLRPQATVKQFSRQSVCLIGKLAFDLRPAALACTSGALVAWCNRWQRMRTAGEEVRVSPPAAPSKSAWWKVSTEAYSRTAPVCQRSCRRRSPTRARPSPKKRRGSRAARRTSPVAMSTCVAVGVRPCRIWEAGDRAKVRPERGNWEERRGRRSGRIPERCYQLCGPPTTSAKNFQPSQPTAKALGP